MAFTKETRRRIVLNNPKLKDALGTIIDLAAQNMLDEDDPDLDDALKKVAKDQGKDLTIVMELYDSL